MAHLAVQPSTDLSEQRKIELKETTIPFLQGTIESRLGMPNSQKTLKGFLEVHQYLPAHTIIDVLNTLLMNSYRLAQVREQAEQELVFIYQQVGLEYH